MTRKPQDVPFARAVGNALRDRGESCALAESCTGGLAAAMLTDEPGASDFFLLGVVCYSNAAKVDLLGVSPVLLDAHGAVSAEVAAAMARGARERAGADVAVAITGVAGPGGGSEEKPVGTVWFGWADAKGESVSRWLFEGDRAHIRRQAAHVALDALRLRRLPEQAR